MIVGLFMMKIKNYFSNCCGAPMPDWVTEDDGVYTGLCPKCWEGCEFIPDNDEEENETE